MFLSVANSVTDLRGDRQCFCATNGLMSSRYEGVFK